MQVLTAFSRAPGSIWIPRLDSIKDSSVFYSVIKTEISLEQIVRQSVNASNQINTKEKTQIRNEKDLRIESKLRQGCFVEQKRHFLLTESNRANVDEEDELESLDTAQN